jgi:hypothetical protein
MQLLATSFGKYASVPMGWIFMTAIVIVEAIIMSQLLSRRLLNPSIIVPVIISNIVSGAVGAFVSKAINKGWMLVIWFPWVSSVEVDVDNTESFFNFLVLFVVAFVVTVLIEVLLNEMFMKSRGFKRVMRATIIANVITYLVACFILYTYSFLFFE